MEQIKDWAVSICITLIVTGIFSMLIPSGNLEKLMKFSVCTFFLCCLLLPFSKGLPSLEWETEVSAYGDTERLEDGVKEQVKRLSQHRVAEVIERVLSEAGIATQKIEPEIHISAENRVSISKVLVTLPKDRMDHRVKAKKLLTEQLGIEVEILLSKK